VEQIYSHYWHLASQNFHSNSVEAMSFERALERFPDRLLEPARYSLHLPRWQALFDEGQLMALLYDDIKTAPQDVLRVVYRFLGVDPTWVPNRDVRQGRDVRAGVAPRNAVAGWAYRVLYRELKCRVFDPLTWRFGTDRVWQWKERLRLRERLQVVFFKKRYPPMAGATRQRLCRELEPDIGAAEALLGVDLRRWRNDSV
jgi:hypothetical protein